MGPESEDDTDTDDPDDDTLKPDAENAVSDGESSGSSFCFINSAGI
jgi:hypothetical protein